MTKREQADELLVEYVLQCGRVSVAMVMNRSQSEIQRRIDFANEIKARILDLVEDKPLAL